MQIEKELNPQIEEDATLLLEIASILLSSGSNTNRIHITIERIAKKLGYQPDLFITQSAFILTLTNTETGGGYSRTMRSPSHGVNFKLVSGISRMSWSIVEENWSREQIKEEMERLKATSHYPRWLVLLMIGIADAAFCRMFGGGYSTMAIVFLATIAGLWIKQELIKRSFNPYITTYLSALVSSLFAGFFVKMDIGEKPYVALATSILFLIPGVPLINATTDFIENKIINGVVRGINGLLISLSIAIGMASAMILFGINL